MNRFILFTILIFLFSCGEKNSQVSIEIKKEKVIKEYGYTLNNYNVKKDTIESWPSVANTHNPMFKKHFF